MGLFKSFFSPKQKESLDKGLKKTNKSFLSKLGNILVGKSKVDVQVLENLRFFGIRKYRISDSTTGPGIGF